MHPPALTTDCRVQALLYAAGAQRPGPDLAEQAPAAVAMAAADFVALVARQLRQGRPRLAPVGVLSIRVVDVRSAYGQVPDALKPPLWQKLGRRLRHRVRGGDTAMWLGDNVYGVVLCHCRPEALDAVRQRLLDALGGSYRIGANQLEVRVAVGSAGPSAADADAQALWDAATGMREAGRAQTPP